MLYSLLYGSCDAVLQKRRPMQVFVVLVVLAALAMHSSCAHHAGRRVVKKQEIESSLSKAQYLYGQGEYEAAIAVLQNGIENMGPGNVSDKSYELLVTWLLQLNRRQEAFQVLDRLTEQDKTRGLNQKLMNLINENQQMATLEEDKSLREFEEDSAQDSPVWSHERE